MIRIRKAQEQLSEVPHGPQTHHSSQGSEVYSRNKRNILIINSNTDKYLLFILIVIPLVDSYWMSGFGLTDGAEVLVLSSGEIPHGGQ